MRNTSPADRRFDRRFRLATASGDTLNPDFKHEVVTDAATAELNQQLFGGVPAFFEAYDALPKPVLKADFFRYLILLARGGVYSDFHATAFKPSSTTRPPSTLPSKPPPIWPTGHKHTWTC
jgi:alpha 1,6-mannosyltransferase